MVYIADDILVHGSGETDEEANINHDLNLWNLMVRCRKINLKLNSDKFRFKQDKLKFMGMIVSKEGMAADPAKAEAINNMPCPTDKKGVQRFVGTCQYLSRFVPNMSESLRPLQELTKNDVKFIWSRVHETAFKSAKEKIMNACLLRYYDVRKPVVLQTDASDTGLGAALMQEGHPVAFTSCKLNSTEQNYAVIEKEMLGIVVAVRHFYQYLYGKTDVTVNTDHQPLQTIFKKPIHSIPKRLQKMMLKVQDYHLKVEYRKGKLMHLADTLSRAPVDRKTGMNTDDAVYAIENTFRVQLAQADLDSPDFTCDSLSRLRLATQADPALSTLGTVIQNGWPHDRANVPPIVSQYWPWRAELAMYNGIIYKTHKVMIPNSMRTEMLRKIHRSHQGGESNLRRARQVMYWPGMAAQILETAQHCGLCAQYKPQLHKEPMMSHPVPSNPWEFVSQDLFKWNGSWYVTMVDHFSDWIEVDKLGSDTTASNVIEKTKGHFARFGIPEKVLTDNGPQYTSAEFKNFAKTWGFQHVTRSPYHEQATGKAESSVKIAKSFLKKANLPEALLEYRNTPQQGLTHSPAQRQLSKHTRTLLPVSKTLLKPVALDNELVKRELEKKRLKSKETYDRGVHAAHPSLQQGEWVYTKPNPTQRGSPWNYGKVLRKETPRSYTITTPKGLVRRNRIQLRAAEPPLRYFEATEVQDEEPNLISEDQCQPLARSNSVDLAVASEQDSSTSEKCDLISKTPEKHSETIREIPSKQSHSTTTKSKSVVLRSGRVTKPKTVLDI